MSAAVLVFRGVCRSFPLPDRRSRDVLRDVAFALPAGAAVALVGRSGSGKSTLIHLAAGIDVPTRGRVEVAGRDIGTLTERDRTLLRRRQVGLIFQFFHLLPHLSVRDNVMLPGWIAGQDTAAAASRADQLLDRVGLADHRHDNAGRLVMDILLRLVREEGATLLFVTHSGTQAARADTIWHLHSGVLRQEPAGEIPGPGGQP